MPDPGNPYASILEAAIQRALEEASTLLDADAALDLAEQYIALPDLRRRMAMRNPSSFARVEVCEQLIEWSYRLRFDDPPMMLALAVEALRALHEVRVRPSRKILHHDALTLAWANLANAHRIHGSIRAADRFLTRAHELAIDGSRDPILRARLHSFSGHLRVEQGRYDEARFELEETVRLREATGDVDGATRAMVDLSRVFLRTQPFEATRDLLLRAMKRLDVRTDPDTVINGLINLVHAYSDAGKPEEALELLKSWDGVFTRGAGEVRRLRLRWLAARLAAQLQQVPRATRELRSLSAAFASLGLSYDAALASLDLAALYASLGHYGQVKCLAEEMLPLFLANDVDGDIRRAFQLWLVSAGALQTSEAEIRRLAAEIERVRGARAHWR